MLHRLLSKHDGRLLLQFKLIFCTEHRIQNHKAVLGARLLVTRVWLPGGPLGATVPERMRLVQDLVFRFGLQKIDFGLRSASCGSKKLIPRSRPCVTLMRKRSQHESTLVVIRIGFCSLRREGQSHLQFLSLGHGFLENEHIVAALFEETCCGWLFLQFGG